MKNEPNSKSIIIDLEIKNAALLSKNGVLEVRLKVATEALQKIKNWDSEQNDEHENLEYFVSKILNNLKQ